MIVGTAGHIDHGKTALIRALTGIETDRLPEEKRRGITLELGYAHLQVVGADPIAFIDVPGHEKLVRTMVSGATSMDYVLLLIAADDGVMPQTEEHAAVISLLGIQHGVAVITKIDKADAALRRLRENEVRTFLERHRLHGFPVLAVSATAKVGLTQLEELLARQARSFSRPAPPVDGFRMPLDRVFSLHGIGTVVAGTVAAGHVHVGDELCLARNTNLRWRVRSLHRHDTTVQEASAGQRCAAGLVGIERHEVERGDVLCEPAIAHRTDRADIRLDVSVCETRPMRSGMTIRLHTGACDVPGTVALLDRDMLQPGDSGLAQLVLRTPIGLWWGDRFVLRDASGLRTLAGGVVLDPDAPGRPRRTPERLAFLASQRSAEPSSRLQGALAVAEHGLDARRWLRVNGLRTWPLNVGAPGGAVIGRSGNWVISREHLDVASEALTSVLKDFHTRQPEDIGPNIQHLRRLVAPRMTNTLWEAFLAQLAQDGTVQQRHGFVHLPEHGAHLRESERLVAEFALPMLQQGAFDPPWVREIAGSARLPEVQVRSVLARLATAGEVYQIVKDLYYHPQHITELARVARYLDGRDGRVLAATFRDATGVGRKRAIQILEFFDRVGLLRRVGDGHVLRPGTLLFPQA